MFLVDVSSVSFKAGMVVGGLALHMFYFLVFMVFLIIPDRTPTRENPMPVFIAGIADPEERKRWDEAD